MNRKGQEPKDKVDKYEGILVLDFGSQYSHLIVRRLRESQIYSELHRCTVELKEVKFIIKGIILSGGPYSVYDVDGPHVREEIFEAGVPILGICYGMQEIGFREKSVVEKGSKREYGSAQLRVEEEENGLFEGSGVGVVWMSHGDRVKELPSGYVKIASTDNCEFAGIWNKEKKIYGLQFHPEVTHTIGGNKILKNFAEKICDIKYKWSMECFFELSKKKIKNTVGEYSHVIGAVSGGVDSTVAAKMMHQAIGERFHAIYVDNGFMRQNETVMIEKMFKEKLGIKLSVIDSKDHFIKKLENITDPEQKRKIIGNTFIEIFDLEAEKIQKKIGKKVEFLLQGTLYPDVIESMSFKGPSQTIKTHHNVGGLLKNMKLKVVEPLRELFKDEVRSLGKMLLIPDDLLYRHPFPGPGLAIRVLGEVTKTQLEIASKADYIFIEEIKKHGLYGEISQAFVVLIPVKTVGVMGDQRTYQQVVSLRAVKTIDFMTADWYSFESNFLKHVALRIVNEVDGVARVTYDITSKPPSTIEWE